MLKGYAAFDLVFAGMNQAGLAECIVRAVSSCHPHLQPLLYERFCLNKILHIADLDIVL